MLNKFFNENIREWDDPSYQRFLLADGEIGISIGTNAENTLDGHAAVLGHAIRSYCIGELDHHRLLSVNPFRIDCRTFHGPWFDCEKGLLIHKGMVTTKQGVSTADPNFVDVQDYASKSSELPNLWHPGGFAYAFCDPPYSLRIERLEVQKLYTAITSQVAPRNDATIYNWHQKEILEVAPQLQSGTEWWGVFAFTTFVPASSCIYGMVAAASD